MALWPFSKKKGDSKAHDLSESTSPLADQQPLPESQYDNEETAVDFEDADVDFLVKPQKPAAETEYTAPDPSYTASPEAEFEEDEDPEVSKLPPDPIHDATSGDSGPFDGDTVNIEDFDFSDFGTGILNLGSMMIPLPHGAEVQVEMGPQGPKMLHILTTYGRCTPVAFAAPTTPGQWSESVPEILQGMQSEDLEVTIEQGPWGKEIVGSAANGGGLVRIIGIDGPRWMLRMTLAAPVEHAENMAELGREITARTFVMRGNDPMLAGTPLPVALPAPLAEQVQKEMLRRQQEAEKNSQ